MEVPVTAAAEGWRARLVLSFRTEARRTVLATRRHSGPLQVQRAFYPEADGSCHAYIVHPPGGVVGGDVLDIEASVEPGARVLLTTPAAGKFYRSSGATARQRQHLRVAAGAALEWLPQESIVFSGARVQASTRVEVDRDGGFLGWETLCLGRPAAGEAFGHGLCRQAFEVWRDGVPLFLETGRYPGGAELLRAPWGLHGRPVTATLVCVTCQAGLVEAARQAAGDAQTGELFAASQLDGVLVCRYLGPGAERARRVFTRIWSVLRPAVLGKAAVPPRIWQS